MVDVLGGDEAEFFAVHDFEAVVEGDEDFGGDIDDAGFLGGHGAGHALGAADLAEGGDAEEVHGPGVEGGGLGEEVELDEAAAGGDAGAGGEGEVAEDVGEGAGEEGLAEGGVVKLVEDLGGNGDEGVLIWRLVRGRGDGDGADGVKGHAAGLDDLPGDVGEEIGDMAKALGSSLRR